jgi:hypothetical protein
MSLQNQLDALNVAVEGVGTTLVSKNAGLEAMAGNDRGLVVVSASGALKNPANSTTDVFGYTYQTAGGLAADISSALPAASPSNIGKMLKFFNSSTHNWTLTAASLNTAYATGAATSVVLPPNATLVLEHDGASYNAIAGTGQIGPTTTVSSANPSGGKNGDVWYQV